MTKRFCLACDLKDQPELIEEYKKYHAPGNTWSEITQSIKAAGVVDMEIYLTGNRLFMIMEVDETFSFERKADLDLSNPRVQEWESLMSTFQKTLPWADKGVKWVVMDRIFKL